MTHRITEVAPLSGGAEPLLPGADGVLPLVGEGSEPALE
jgi:hypothetical protein